MPPKINIDKIVSIAMDAGKLVLDIYEQDSFSQRLKSDDSPLTEADTASHNFIVQQLQEITPSIPILSEEASDITWDVRKHWNCYWLIDGYVTINC